MFKYFMFCIFFSSLFCSDPHMNNEIEENVLVVRDSDNKNTEEIDIEIRTVTWVCPICGKTFDKPVVHTCKPS